MRSKIINLVYLILVIAIVIRCKKEGPQPVLPVLTTTELINITDSSAISGGNITFDGGITISDCGICWSKTPSPTLSNFKNSCILATEIFDCLLTSLSPNTMYYVRAYAVNRVGVSYGNEVNFKTLATSPVTITDSIYSITQFSATVNSNVLSDGGMPIIKRGICFNTRQNPTLKDSTIVSDGSTGSFKSYLSGLASGTHYYVRSYAINNVDTAYGNEISFSTLPGLPSVRTSVENYGIPCRKLFSVFVYANGGSTLINKGICYSNSPNPTISSSNIGYGPATIGPFSFLYKDLPANTLFYVRAFATNSIGTAYGNEISFTTLPEPMPVVNTYAMSDIGPNQATANGEIIGYGCQILERGFCFSKSPNPTTANNKTITGNNPITQNKYSQYLLSLAPNTLYYVRAYLTNNAGTGYGNEVSFTTNAALPILTTNTINNITATSAISGGNITDNGGGWITARGICWSTSQSPTIVNSATSSTNNGTGSGSFESLLTSLTPNTTYYVRAYAANRAGTAYGNQQSFLTISAPGFPTLTTNSVSNIGTTSAICGGYVTNVGDAEVTSRGVVWGTNLNPSKLDNYTNDGIGPGNFTSSITGLKHSTWYHIRSFAENSHGIAYGDELTFRTLNVLSNVIDYEGNTYNTVIIGNQEWMSENLKVTHYSDGRIIPYITDDVEWKYLGDNNSDKAYCYYNNSVVNRDTYGALYTWAAAMDGNGSSTANPSGIQGVCPTGWHLPSNSEWAELFSYLGGKDVAGGKMKEAGTIHWNTPNTGATNESGFSALPGGSRDSGTGNFKNIGVVGYWLSTFQGSYNYYAYICYLIYNRNLSTFDHGDMSEGYSVRCVKDK